MAAATAAWSVAEAATTGSKTKDADIKRKTEEEARYFDLEIRTCIYDFKKGTKKTKEMQQLVQSLKQETISVNSPRFELKASTTLITQLLEAFAASGGTLVQIYYAEVTFGPGIVFGVRYHTREDLQNTWKMYNNSSKLKDMLKATIISENNFSKHTCKKFEINVEIEQKNYTKGLKNFPKEKTKKSAVTDGTEETTEPDISKSADNATVPLSLVQFVAHSRESFANADKEIDKVKEEIQEKCKQLQELSKSRETRMGIFRRNLETAAAKISFDNPAVQQPDTTKVSKKTIKRKAESGRDTPENQMVKKSDKDEEAKKVKRTQKETSNVPDDNQGPITKTLLEATRRKEEGNTNLKQGNIGMARREYANVEELLYTINPSSGKGVKAKDKILQEIYTNIAECCLFLQDPAEAFNYSGKALQLDQNNATALFKHGTASHRLSKLDTAEQSLKKALSYCPLHEPSGTQTFSAIQKELSEVQRSLETWS